jgi:hypothetical protein
MRLIRCKDTKKWAKNKIKTRIFVFGLFRRLFCGEKTGFGRRGTSIAGKAFVERGCDEVGIARIHTCRKCLYRKAFPEIEVPIGTILKNSIKIGKCPATFMDFRTDEIRHEFQKILHDF